MANRVWKISCTRWRIWRSVSPCIAVRSCRRTHRPETAGRTNCNRRAQASTAQTRLRRQPSVSQGRSERDTLDTACTILLPTGIFPRRVFQREKRTVCGPRRMAYARAPAAGVDRTEAGKNCVTGASPLLKLRLLDMALGPRKRQSGGNEQPLSGRVGSGRPPEIAGRRAYAVPASILEARRATICVGHHGIL